MNFTSYLNLQELGKPKAFKHNGSSSKDISFILNRLQCNLEDVFFIPGQLPSSAVPPFQSRFCPELGYQHIYSLASEEGKVVLLDSEKPLKKSLLSQWIAHDNAVFDLCWVGHDKLITASGDKSAVLWDVVSRKQVAVCKGHGCSLKTLSVSPSNPNIFASGARDGNIMFWDVRCFAEGLTCNPKFFIGNAHDGTLAQGTPKQKRRRISRTPRVNNPLNSITCIQFQDDNVLLSSGSSDRKIKGWDMRFLSSQKNAEKTPLAPIELDYPGSCVRSHGYTSLVLHPEKTSFFANCTDGVIYQYSCSSNVPKLVSTYYGHKVGSFFVKMDISNDGNYILSGSSDNYAYIWKLSNPGAPLLRLTGHDAEVTAVAWCPSDFTKVITCSDDDKVLNWSLKHCPGLPSSDLNPVIGKAEPIDPTGITCPRKTPKHSTVERSIPSVLMSPITPSSKSKLNSPALTQWFTPTSAKSKRQIRPTPPNTPSKTTETPVKNAETPVKNTETPVKISGTLVQSPETPVKSPNRMALCDLSLKNNVNSPSMESFMSMKKRVLEEQKLLAATSKGIRRTLVLEVPPKEDEAKPSTSALSNVKENVQESASQPNTPERQSHRKSPIKKAQSPKKALKRCLKSYNTSQKPSYSIKHFFRVIPTSKNP